MSATSNPDLAPVAGRLDPDIGVPLIDLSGDPAEVTARIGRACAEWGFFQLVGHGVAPSLAGSAMASARAFFALPKAAKRAVSRSRDNPWGYYDRELTRNVRDRKEIFDIGADGEGEAPFAGTTPWPVEVPGFEPALRGWFAACEQVSARLLDHVSLSLGAPADSLRRAFSGTHTSFLRLNHYPVEDPLGDEAAGGADLGIHHHTDAGALTLLLQDEVSGLQVHRGGAWHTVSPVEGAFVVNIGDMVQVWSNDLYRAPLHRVLAMERSDRLSLPFFYNPAYDTRVAPLEAVLGRSEPRYRPISWGEYRRRRADGDFADYGAEVQISDYRIEPA